MDYIIGHIHYHMKATLNLTHSYGNIFFQVHHTAEETSLPPKEMQYFFKWNYLKEKGIIHTLTKNYY